MRLLLASVLVLGLASCATAQEVQLESFRRGTRVRLSSQAQDLYRAVGRIEFAAPESLTIRLTIGPEAALALRLADIDTLEVWKKHPRRRKAAVVGGVLGFIGGAAFGMVTMPSGYWVEDFNRTPPARYWDSHMASARRLQWLALGAGGAAAGALFGSGIGRTYAGRGAAIGAIAGTVLGGVALVAAAGGGREASYAILVIPVTGAAAGAVVGSLVPSASWRRVAP